MRKMKNAKGNLFLALNNLEYLLLKCKPAYATAAVIPPIARGYESEPLNRISVLPKNGKAAVKLASSCYQDLFIKDDLSQKSSRRTVGAIWVKDSAKDEIYEAVCDVNSIKAEIEEYVLTGFESRSQRFDALREILPGVMSLHLYRQIRVFHDESLSAARFSWQQKDSLVIPNKDELVSKILMDSDASFNNEYKIALKMLAERVSSISSDELRLRRQVKIQPVANLTINGKNKTVTAPMPLLILQKEPIDIKMIPSFDVQDRMSRPTRSDKTKSEVVGTFAGTTIEWRRP